MGTEAIAVSKIKRWFILLLSFSDASTCVVEYTCNSCFQVEF